MGKKQNQVARKEMNEGPPVALHDENLFPALGGGITTPSSSSSISHAPAGIWATRTTAWGPPAPSTPPLTSPSPSSQSDTSNTDEHPSSTKVQTEEEPAAATEDSQQSPESTVDSPSWRTAEGEDENEEIMVWGSLSLTECRRILALDCPQVRLAYTLPIQFHLEEEKNSSSLVDGYAPVAYSTSSPAEKKSVQTESTTNESSHALAQGFIPSASVIRSMQHTDIPEFYPSPGMVSVPPLPIYGEEAYAYPHHPMMYPGVCCPPWGVPPPWAHSGVHTYPN